MNRRDFLATATAASAVFALTGCNESNHKAIDYSKHPKKKDAQRKRININKNKKTVITLATSWPAHFPIMGTGVEKFAQRAGIDLPRDKKYDAKKASLTENLYKLNQLAERYYHQTLKSNKGKEAYEYLRSRGVSTEIIDKFALGYAPNAWEQFRTFCKSRKIPDSLLRDAGLSIPSEKGKNDYDRFRNRIIFPIHNERGKIVAFGGRVLDSSLPKYINSPDSAVYSKSNILYGLYPSKNSIRENKHVIIVEGYLDVIIPFQFGISNVVAASGTALTQNQIVMLKKYTDTAIMVFDSDSAGEAASLRGLDILLENNMKVRIATLPENEDPDSFLRKNGKHAFEKIIADARDLFDYKLDLLKNRYGTKDIASVVDEMLPTIYKIQHAVLQSEYIRKLAEALSRILKMEKLLKVNSTKTVKKE